MLSNPDPGEEKEYDYDEDGNIIGPKNPAKLLQEKQRELERERNREVEEIRRQMHLEAIPDIEELEEGSDQGGGAVSSYPTTTITEKDPSQTPRAEFPAQLEDPAPQLYGDQGKGYYDEGSGEIRLSTIKEIIRDLNEPGLSDEKFSHLLQTLLFVVAREEARHKADTQESPSVKSEKDSENG